jgi:hypothetical protein
VKGNDRDLSRGTAPECLLTKITKTLIQLCWFLLCALNVGPPKYEKKMLTGITEFSDFVHRPDFK